MISDSVVSKLREFYKFDVISNFADKAINVSVRQSITPIYKSEINTFNFNFVELIV